MAQDALKLMELQRDDVPDDLKPEAYFDFEAHPFAHRALFDNANSVCQAIRDIDDYATGWLSQACAEMRARQDVSILSGADVHACVKGAVEAVVCEGAVFEPRCVIGAGGGTPHTILVCPGAHVVGCDLYLEKGDIYVGSGATVEAGVGVKGPTIIGKGCEVRQGAYLRGDCILGDECVIRGELKNTVVMDKANFPHPSYLGDSACGYMTHFGNQVTAANLGIYEGMRERDKRHNLVLRVGGKGYDIGTPKMGVCMGDFCQIGCNSTTDPGTFLKPYTIAYTLTRIAKGFYGPNVVLKNKPIEHGVVETVPLQPL